MPVEEVLFLLNLGDKKPHVRSMPFMLGVDKQASSDAVLMVRSAKFRTRNTVHTDKEKEGDSVAVSSGEKPEKDKTEKGKEKKHHTHGGALSDIEPPAMKPRAKTISSQKREDPSSSDQRVATSSSLLSCLLPLPPPLLCFLVPSLMFFREGQETMGNFDRRS